MEVRRPWLTYAAMGLAAVVFVLHALASDPWEPETLRRFGVLWAWDVYDGGWWALVTSVFVHADPLHVGFNLYWLWVLGRPVERAVGPLRWLALFVAAAWVSSAFQLAVSGDTGIGLSGVGYALVGFIWMAKTSVRALRNVIGKDIVFLFIAWMVLGVILTAAGVMNIGNTAHLAGLLFGLAAGGIARHRGRVPAITAAAFLFVMATGTLLWAPWSPAWNSLEGRRAEDRGDHHAALRLFTRAIDQDPDWAYPRTERGMSRISVGNYSGAVSDFQISIEEDPDDERALRGMRHVAWIWATAPDENLRDPPRGVRLARQVVGLRPDDAYARNALGIALYRTGEWQAAIDALEEARRLRGDDPDASDLFFLAMAHRRLGHTDDAQALREQAEAAMPEDDEEYERFRAEADELFG